MGARQKEWARKKRVWLLAVLGGKCVLCGTTQNLTFDCRVPRGGKHHQLSLDQRMSFYLREWRACNLQVLCDICNSTKQDKPMPTYIPTPAQEKNLVPREEGRRREIDDGNDETNRLF